jgi:hypothetical protein
VTPAWHQLLSDDGFPDLGDAPANLVKALGLACKLDDDRRKLWPKET